MNNNLGKKIRKLRKAEKLSQSNLAERIGVNCKMVSKWENGTAMPRANMIQRIADLFCIEVGELHELSQMNAAPDITKIVITGGPCAGKTTALSRVQEEFTRMGYSVLIVSETATELICGGIAPWNCGTNADFQKCMFRMQTAKEKVFLSAAKSMDADKILIVCDRGAMDNRAYMTDDEFTELMSAMGCNLMALRDSYDAVFHLVTAAKGAEDCYTKANNVARSETIEEAARLDNKIISAWTGHPHFRVIDNSTDFEEKQRRLIAEIASFLGEPEPLEIERKFLIKYPDIEWLESEPYCSRVEITQTYLKSNADGEVRVRRRGIDGDYIYFKTTKRNITPIKRVEVEKRLSREEYLSLLSEADSNAKQISKTRYCLVYEGQYFEIDIYPFWKDKAIVEIELGDELSEIVFPPQLEVIREVSGEDAYKNSSLAARVDSKNT